MDSDVVSAAKPYVAAVVRHVATAGAGYLVAHSVIAPDDQAKLISLFSAVVLFIMAQAWSLFQKMERQRELDEHGSMMYAAGRAVSAKALGAKPTAVQQGG